ncbi:MAG TPA: HD domain-containing protein, partial [Burkholderiales bacterium]|nr:HD domain-containing protein [Burkholderiales bacterium]
MGDMKLGQRAGFTSMKSSTRQDWDIIVERYQPFARELPDRILAHLKVLGEDDGGFAVTRLHHSLLTATLAHKGGEDEEYVVCALLHDIGDTLGSWNHPDVSAAIVKPFVSEANHWMVEKHGIFQGYYFFE